MLSRGSRAPADGLIEVDGRQLVELEDVTRRYKHPSIADIKVGLRTWYSGAEQSYIERCKLKDAATTQAALGYKVCGMQVGSQLAILYRVPAFSSVDLGQPAVVHIPHRLAEGQAKMALASTRQSV